LTPSSGLLIVRIVWIAAILVGVLAILVGLLSGTDGGPSRDPPQAASAPGFSFEAQQKPESANAPAAHEDRNRVAKRIPVASRPSSGVQSGSADQPVDAGGDAPTVTPSPEPEPAPQPRPTPTHRPSPPPAAPQPPVSPQPAPPQPVQPAIVANNNDGP
jgi:hypothetical protein